MNYQTRTNSILTDQPNLEHLYTFKDFPVFIGCTDQDPSKDLKFDMIWDICRDTGIIQLRNLLPLEVIYSEYHCEAVGDFWKKHHEEFSKVVQKYSGKNILEIGGSNGFLARNFLESYKDKDWTIIEPNPKEDFEEEENLKVIKGFFDDNFLEEGFDTVVHSHVLEHMYDPKKFLVDVSEFLVDGQYHIFSFPNLYTYLEKGFTNVINFEHTIFLTEFFLDEMLPFYNFEVIEKNYYNDHSIFYVTKKNSDVDWSFYTSKYDTYKSLYLKTIEDYKKTIDEYNRVIDSSSGKVFLFGAHIFSQLPLNLGLDSSRVDSILDNSKMKDGKRLYGTSLLVKNPIAIKDLVKPIVIVNVGSYKDEIIKQLKDLNSSVIII